MPFVIKSSFDGQPAVFAWYGPDEWYSDHPGLEAEVQALIDDGEPLGLTPTGPFYDAGVDTAEEAYALARSAFDANGDPIELLQGELPKPPPVPEDAIS